MKLLHRSFTARLLEPSPVPAAKEIEFSAQLQEFEGEDSTGRGLVFKDADRIICYHPPSGWICTLVGKHLYLKPPNQNFAAAEIKAVPLIASQPVDKIIAAALSEQVLTHVPEGAEETRLVREEMNPVALNHYQSYEVVVSYSALRQKFQRSVIFLSTPANRIVFKFTARQDIFDPLYQAFRHSISTWEWN